MENIKVKNKFIDKFSKKKYEIGDVYESDDAKRIEFLQGKGFVEEEDEANKSVETDAEYPKHTGGGWYELSNGEKVQGKDEATAAEEDLKKSGE